MIKKFNPTLYFKACLRGEERFDKVFLFWGILLPLIFLFSVGIFLELAFADLSKFGILYIFGSFIYPYVYLPISMLVIWKSRKNTSKNNLYVPLFIFVYGAYTSLYILISVFYIMFKLGVTSQ